MGVSVSDITSGGGVGEGGGSGVWVASLVGPGVKVATWVAVGSISAAAVGSLLPDSAGMPLVMSNIDATTITTSSTAAAMMYMRLGFREGPFGAVSSSSISFTGHLLRC